MASQVLLVSNPPHPRVDAQVAASVFGLLPADANLKVRYSVPEIWLADTDASVVEQAATRLRAGGMRCVIVRGEDLLAVPSPLLVPSFALCEQSVTLVVGDQRIEIAHDHSPIIVSSTPRPAEGAPPSLRTTIAPGVEVRELCPFVHFYLAGGLRLAVYAELVDFAGLGDQMGSSQSGNMARFGQLLQQRLTHARFDNRLLNMQLRRRLAHGVPPTLRESRKGYSFASPGLDALLEAIAPELLSISQSELSSRLAYLTTRVSS
ncbi:MAG: hypothetical protein ACT4O1_07480 [Gemmatimonadota bacterium]